MRTTLILIAALAFGPALAGKIYKCVDASGAVTFTNIQCPADTERTGETEYRPVADAPASAPTQWETAVDEWRAAPVQSRPVATSPTSSIPSAYQCVANNRTWVQRDPCPLTYERTVHRPISGHANLIGGGTVPVDGTVRQVVTTPIREQGLSRDAICAQLRSNDVATARTGENRDSTYERNKMRDAYGCH